MNRPRGAADWRGAIVVLSRVVTVAVAVTAMAWGQAVFIPLALAILLTLILAPVVTAIERHGPGRTAAVATVIIGLTAALVGVGWLASGQVNELARQSPELAHRAAEKLKAARAWVGDGGAELKQATAELRDAITPPKPADEPTRVVVESAVPGWLAPLGGLLPPVVEIVGLVALALVLTVFLLLKREDARDRVLWLLGRRRLGGSTMAVEEMSRRISQYLFAQLLLNVGFGIVLTLGLWSIGVPYAVLWGLIATVMRYVPYVGTWISLLAPMALSFVRSDGWTEPLLVLALFGGLELVCNNFLEPLLYGKSLGVSEVAIIVAAVFWTLVWGPIGLVLSGPLTVCLVVFGRFLPRMKWLAVLLGDLPALDANVVFYQRLAAHDLGEAKRIARDSAAAGQPPEVADELIVPALARARRDYRDGDLSAEDAERIADSACELAAELSGRCGPKGGSGFRVTIVPARDHLDEAAATVLRAVVPDDWDVTALPAETLAAEAVAAAADAAAVCVAVQAPGGKSHARYLCKRLRSARPDVTIVLGYWGAGDAVKNGRRDEFMEAGADAVTSLLTETVASLAALKPVERKVKMR